MFFRFLERKRSRWTKTTFRGMESSENAVKEEKG